MNPKDITHREQETGSDPVRICNSLYAENLATEGIVSPTKSFAHLFQLNPGRVHISYGRR